MSADWAELAVSGIGLINWLINSAINSENMAASNTRRNRKSTDLQKVNFKSQVPYSQRLAAYLSGDSTQTVSLAFANAVAAIGSHNVAVHLLTSTEKLALSKKDLRWRPSPDGNLFWAPQALGNISHNNSPDFSWLADSALQKFRQIDETSNVKEIAIKGDAPAPKWLARWVEAWTFWASRFASIRYDRAYLKAKSNNSPKPFGAAASGTSKMSRNIRIFLLDYIPHASLVRIVGRGQENDDMQWLLPEELLDATFRGEIGPYRDDFWNRCCLGYETRRQEEDGRIKYYHTIGSTRSHDIQHFLDFVAEKLNEGSGETSKFENPFRPRSVAGVILIPSTDNSIQADAGNFQWSEIEYRAPIARSSDKTCSWISREYPHLLEWEPFAREYIQSIKKDVRTALAGLSIFFERYLANAGNVATPGEQLDPECAKRPISSKEGLAALLRFANKDQVPKTIDVLSVTIQKAAVRNIRDGFVPYILNMHCSLIDGDDTTLLPEYWNPFASIVLDDAKPSARSETGRNAMPYVWIRKLRNILVQGPHFCDWKWAQQAQQSERGNSADWVKVEESLIDRADPDCVWRKRTLSKKNDNGFHTIFEIWSPVRWVSLVTKLNTALRTAQVRLLDSGESDIWRFDLRQWAQQTFPSPFEASPFVDTTEASSIPSTLIGPGAPWIVNNVKILNRKLYESIKPQEAIRKLGAKRDPETWMNGVLRAYWVYLPNADQQQLTTLLYFNTNKTADAKKEGASKGFEVAFPILPCPLPTDEGYWIRSGTNNLPLQRSFTSTSQHQAWLDDLGENIHWWLAKLRDWQEKYNPIERRIEWKELSRTGLSGEKSDEQYEMYRPTCFLFREPSMGRSKSHPGPEFPMSDSVVANAWWALCKELQVRINAEREDGQSEFRLVLDIDGYNKACTFDLHSIRVSIITALIVDGKVPVQYVQALVGHSRLIMTIYYTKLNPLTMMQEIASGFRRASEAEVESQRVFLRNATVEELRSRLAFNDPESALAALGASRPPDLRNVVMWMRKLGGICPVGGVSHNTESGLPAGCFNGGPLMSGTSGEYQAKYAPVEGGPGTCVNCRWFVTKLPFIGELQAIAENSLYRYHEFKEKTSLQEKKIQSISAEYEKMEIENGVLTNAQKILLNRDLEAAEAIRDGYMESAAHDVMISGNAFGLIQRLVAIHGTSDGVEEGKLIANGSESELRVILDQTDSAMLHSARICLHSEIHPEINAASATLRAAMIVARKLQEEDIDPFMLLSLPEEVQTKAVNAVMRHIASLCDPKNLNLGLSRAASLMESKHKLSEITGAPTFKLLEWVSGLASGLTEMPVPELPNHSSLLVN